MRKLNKAFVNLCDFFFVELATYLRKTCLEDEQRNERVAVVKLFMVLNFVLKASSFILIVSL